MDPLIDKFIDEIYELESNGMLSDLALSPHLCIQFLDFDEDRRVSAIKYIKSILKQCYDQGQLQIAASYEDDLLYGYAMIFAAPNLPKYLHKIFVKESFRGHGIGSQIMDAIAGSGDKLCLLCPSDTVGFYEPYGFEYVQPFTLPSSKNFQLSRGIYSGLCVMNNYKEELGAPIFFLNDQDIMKIIGLNE